MFSYDVTAAILVFQNNKTAAMLVSKLNTLDNTDTETISVFRFSFFSCLCSQDAGGYAISRQNNLELHLGCPTCWLSYFTLVCLWCSRAGERSRDYQNFSDG